MTRIVRRVGPLLQRRRGTRAPGAEAQLLGPFTRRDVPVVGVGSHVTSALAAGDAAGFGPALAVNAVVADLVHRMHHVQVIRTVVTRADGTLVGLFFAADIDER